MSEITVPMELGNVAQKTGTMLLLGQEKSSSLHDTIHECDGQTDRQMDTGRQLVPRLRIAVKIPLHQSPDVVLSRRRDLI